MYIVLISWLQPHLFADPTIALPYISITEQDLVDMEPLETELTTMHTLNSGSKGAIKRKFFEADGKVYFKSEDVPADAKKVEEVEYTILNMFSINSIKQKGNLCVEDVEGLSSNNAWIRQDWCILWYEEEYGRNITV